MKRTDINFSKSDSDSFNSGDDKIETMDCLDENNNKTIKRVWIVKKSIALGDLANSNIFASFRAPSSSEKSLRQKIKAFEIKDETKCRFKHCFKNWATILELSNGTYVNIQFGAKGFSLKEFNKTKIDGESVLDSIVETWGYSNHPFSFCYLGEANYDYDKLKEKLKEIKNEELKRLKDKGSVYYHLVHRNCQHFACDLEKILFGSIQVWHPFDYYLLDFYQTFFSEINIDNLKRQLKNKRSA